MLPRCRHTRRQLAALALLIAVPGAGAADLPAALREAPCFDEAFALLDDWGSTHEYLPLPDVGDVGAWRSPTAELGTWVLVRLDDGSVGGLLRLSGQHETDVDLDASCEITTTVREHARFDDGVTDDEVRRIVERGTVGVFYAWSPHMPLSVDGLAEIRAAGQRLGIDVTFMLASQADVDFARERAADVGAGEDVLRLNRSIELMMRDIELHAPAVLVYANGRFVSPVIPGFRYAADYEALISRFLGAGN